MRGGGWLESGEVWTGQRAPFWPGQGSWLPPPPQLPRQLSQPPSSLLGRTGVYVCDRQWRGRWHQLWRASTEALETLPRGLLLP